MDIKEVIPNEFYKEQYVAVNERIFTYNRAVAYFPQEKEMILKTVNSALKPASAFWPVIFRELPTKEKMIERIQEERNKVYKSLNLKITSSEDEKQEQAYIVFCYLIKNFSYDMMVKEEINAFDMGKKHAYYKQKLQEHLVKLKNLEINCKNAENEDKKKILEKVRTKCYSKANEFFSKMKEEQEKFDNDNLIKSIYKVLIEKRGICGHIAYTYSYLLNGLNIKNCILLIKNKESDNQDIYHTFNLLETKSNDKTMYYAADLTYGNSYYQSNKNLPTKIEHYNTVGFYLDSKDVEKLNPNYEVVHQETIKKIVPQEKQFVPYVEYYQGKRSLLQEFKNKIITKENSLENK